MTTTEGDDPCGGGTGEDRWMRHREALDWEALLPPAGRRGLLHLLGCRTCRAIAMARSLEELPWSDGAPSAAGDENHAETSAFSAIASDLARMVTGQVAGGELACPVAALTAALLAMPWARRFAAVATDPRFLDVDLLEELVSRAQECDGEESEHLARLALVLSAELRRTGPEVHVREELVVNAYGLVAGARLVAGDLAGATEALANATRHLRGAKLDATGRGWYCRRLGLLRQREGRLEEAAALLRHAAGLFQRGGEVLEEGGALAELGLLYLDAGEAHDALAPLTWARRLLIPELVPAGWRRASLACACAWAAAGDQARAQLIEGEVASYDRTSLPTRDDPTVMLLRARLEALGVSSSSLPSSPLPAGRPAPRDGRA